MVQKVRPGMKVVAKTVAADSKPGGEDKEQNAGAKDGKK